ncbi:HAD family hydrolase [Poritiphilus sp. M415]|uniref:HAD family hydrolase n=2 Tax=Lentiprolixibacter aurantiacus TaxID=2993939 RepID=A0AAE3SPC7_9FLAO|nr:HAD family hydrolase [Lentiprolixibacter aurantiacus]MCX2720076.1 HAD family hydrolase [Lentiprolixibacter aurantiacus]
MDLSRVKLVVTDMDGTLLNKDHQVSPYFFELYSALKAKGVHFAAASGRQHNSIADKLAPIKDEIFIIAENGGFVTDRGKEILSTPLQPEMINQILDVVTRVEGAKPVLCSKDNAYVLESHADFQEKLKEYYTRFELLSDLKEFDGVVMKIAVFHYDGSETYLYPAVREFESELKVKVSGENWLDLSHPNAHKGFALSRIQKAYRISREETMVFGDYNNDLEMLGQASFSFAMANAHPNILRAARYTTLSNNEMGVERILEQLLAQLN